MKSVQSRRRLKRISAQSLPSSLIELSLYVNGIAYEYGITCHFCAKNTAKIHCPTCEEFYCDECDNEIHSYGKRIHHHRTILSKYDMHTAALVITRFIRFAIHLFELQRRCRAVFKRYYDSKTMNHYYYNPIYKTTSWRKPYCLRRFELLPFLTKDQAAARIQGLYRSWRARGQAIHRITSYYTKLFHRQFQEFYYTFEGPSTLVPRQSWKKPVLLGRRGYPQDLIPLFTEDVAAIRIQRKWRIVLVCSDFLNPIQILICLFVIVANSLVFIGTEGV